MASNIRIVCLLAVVAALALVRSASATSLSLDPDITGGGSFTWVFDVTGGTIAEEWHLGAQYANAVARATGKIISADGVPSDGPPIPEPSAALLFGVGAVLVSRRVRTRR